MPRTAATRSSAPPASSRSPLRSAPKKDEIVAQLRARLEEQLEALTASQQASQAGAAHEETRAEDPKDMRSTEASYLARGLADRVGDLQTQLVALARFTPVALAPGAAIVPGALIDLEDEDGEETTHFLVPAGGGEKLRVENTTIHALSPTSPLGQELVGREVDEDFELELPRGRTTLTIVRVR